MKNLIKYLLISALVLFAACESDKDDNISLKISPQEITLDEDMNKGTFTITGSGDWSIAPSESWCTAEPQRGNGNATITVTGTEYGSDAERMATLTVTSGKSKKNVKIIQKGSVLTLSSRNMSFDAAGTSQTITVKSGVGWSVSPADGVTVDPMNGSGDGTLTVTLTPNPVRKKREYSFKVKFANSGKTVNITQDEGPNNVPTKPVLTNPDDEATGLSILPEFSWTASADADEDELLYTVYYSPDKTEWTKTETVADLSVKPESPLETLTTYYWKVRVSDGNGGETESETRSFTTSDTRMFPNGSYVVYNGGLPLNGTVPVIFIGDGFTAEDCIEGGLFDRKADEGIEAFFSVEPYITYIEHFKVYKIYAHSKESGASRWSDDKGYLEYKNTAFNTRYYGDGYTSTLMKTDCSGVYDYARRIPGITQDVLNNTTVVLIVNDPVYSGTCWMDWSGSSVSIVPTCDEKQPYSYRMTMVHEASGHGFGRLADEYLYANRPVTEEERTNLVNWSGQGANMNIDVTSSRADIKWKHFFGVTGYESVDVFGGAQYSYGVWMPEESSVMKNMKHMYFNAPSREAIVKRIMKNLNREYAFEEFINKDDRTKPAIPARVAGARIPAHTPPQMLERQ